MYFFTARKQAYLKFGTWSLIFRIKTFHQETHQLLMKAFHSKLWTSFFSLLDANISFDYSFNYINGTRTFYRKTLYRKTICQTDILPTELCRTNILSNGLSESQPLKLLCFRQVVVLAKCLFGEKSVRQNVRSTKCRQNVRSAKCLSAKCLSAKCLSAKCLSAKCPATTLTILVGVLKYMLYNILRLFLNNYVSNSSTA